MPIHILLFLFSVSSVLFKAIGNDFAVLTFLKSLVNQKMHCRVEACQSVQGVTMFTYDSMRFFVNLPEADDSHLRLCHKFF